MILVDAIWTVVQLEAESAALGVVSLHVPDPLRRSLTI